MGENLRIFVGAIEGFIFQDITLETTKMIFILHLNSLKSYASLFFLYLFIYVLLCVYL